MTNATRSRAEVAELVVAAIARVCELDRAPTLDTPLVDEIELDSLTMLRLDAAFQSELGIAMRADDIENVVTISDLVQALIERGQPVCPEEI